MQPLLGSLTLLRGGPVQPHPSPVPRTPSSLKQVCPHVAPTASLFGTSMPGRGSGFPGPSWSLPEYRFVSVGVGCQRQCLELCEGLGVLGGRAGNLGDRQVTVARLARLGSGVSPFPPL